MEISSKRTGGELSIYLSGELDHHSARSAIPEISRIIDVELPVSLTLDFSGVSFMDSSGIAVVIGAYKKASALGGVFSVTNVSKQAYKVFFAAGVCRLVKINMKDNEYAKI